MSCRMKKSAVAIVSFVMVLLFSFPSFSYYMNNKDLYGEPEKSYEEGYEDGSADGDVRYVYKTREVSAKEYITDHATRFRELYLTALIAIAICVAPILAFRYLICKKGFDDKTACAVAVVYNIFASVLIAYLMYRIDYLVPCMSIVILSAIFCKKVLTA